MNRMEDWKQRTRLLLGDEKIGRMRDARVVVVGLGGVGAYAAEMLCRAGVGHLTLVDADTVQPTNLNRQLPALHSTLGRPKADVLAERLRDINPEIDLDVLPVFLKEEQIPELLDAGRFDFVVDAIDTLAPKCHLIAEALRRRIRIISSMGAGAHRGHVPLRAEQGGQETLAEDGHPTQTAGGVQHRTGRPARRAADGGRTEQEVDLRHGELHARRLRLLPGGIRHQETMTY